MTLDVRRFRVRHYYRMCSCTETKPKQNEKRNNVKGVTKFKQFWSSRNNGEKEVRKSPKEFIELDFMYTKPL